MAENDIEALAVEQAAKAIHAAHMADKGPLHEWKWEEASKPFYYRLAHAAITALRSTTAEPVDDDGPCTDCDDTGITIQTERPCTCDAALRSTTAATDSAAKDAEIAAYREALNLAANRFARLSLELPFGSPERYECGEWSDAARAATLANRGEAV